MSVCYKGLLRDHISAIDIAKVIGSRYGGQKFNIRFGYENFNSPLNDGHYIITFEQEYTPEVKAMRPWERSAHATHRQMNVFTDGCCACDYEEVTSDPMTMVTLGHSGDCKEIINALVAHFGGYVLDETVSEEWEMLSVEDIKSVLNLTESRKALIEG